MRDMISSLLCGLLRALQQFLQLFFQDLVGSLLCLDVILVRLTICLLLFLVLYLHITNFLLQLMHLFLKILRLSLQSADLVLHVLLLLLSLKSTTHPESDG